MKRVPYHSFYNIVITLFYNVAVYISGPSIALPSVHNSHTLTDYFDFVYLTVDETVDSTQLSQVHDCTCTKDDIILPFHSFSGKE